MCFLQNIYQNLKFFYLVEKNQQLVFVFFFNLLPELSAWFPGDVD